MKKISSPVKTFQGSITLPSFLTLPQCLKFEQANREVEELKANNPNCTRTEIDAILLPVIFEIVQKWDITGITGVDDFPATPRLESARLIAWAMNEITALYVGEVEVPND